jgi:hypothetical protein
VEKPRSDAGNQSRPDRKVTAGVESYIYTGDNQACPAGIRWPPQFEVRSINVEAS